MKPADPQRYSYEDAGYNGFFRRSIASSPTERTLNMVGINRSHNSREINFDESAASGSIGDNIRAGRVNINGPGGNINIQDTEGVEVTRIGDMEA